MESLPRSWASRRHLRLALGGSLLVLVASACGSGAATHVGAPPASSTASSAAVHKNPAASSKSITAETVIKDLAKRGLPIKVLVVYSAATDPNHLLGRPNGYVSKAQFADARVPTKSLRYVGKTSLQRGGSVEVFSTPAGAVRRARYIQRIEKGLPALGSEYDYVDKTVLLRVSGLLTPTQAAADEAALAAIMGSPARLVTGRE